MLFASLEKPFLPYGDKDFMKYLLLRFGLYPPVPLGKSALVQINTKYADLMKCVIEKLKMTYL
jgi:hypothetical protein